MPPAAISEATLLSDWITIMMLVRLKLLQLGNICSRQSKFSHMRGFVFPLLLIVSAFLLRAELPREIGE